MLHVRNIVRTFTVEATMPFALSTPFVLLLIAIAYNHWGKGNWGSTAVGFMLACSVAGTAWFALGKQAGDTTRDVVGYSAGGVQSGLTAGGGGATATTVGR